MKTTCWRKRTSDELSVHTGEMIALLLAIQWIEEIRPLKSVICSDSCASLASLLYSHSESRPDILMEIMQTMGITAVFLWVPAHIGIQGNETADKEAKAAVKNNDINIIVNLSKSEIKKRLKERWQKQWDKEKKGWWFYRIQRKVGDILQNDSRNECYSFIFQYLKITNLWERI